MPIAKSKSEATHFASDAHFHFARTSGSPPPPLKGVRTSSRYGTAGWLNTESFLVTQPAAASHSTRKSKSGGKKVRTSSSSRSLSSSSRYGTFRLVKRLVSRHAERRRRHPSIDDGEEEEEEPKPAAANFASPSPQTTSQDRRCKSARHFKQKR